MTKTTAESLARAYFGAVGAGDTQTLAELLADDVVYHFPGRSPFAGKYEGRDAVLGYLARLRDTTSGTMSVRVVDVMISRDHAAGWVEATARRGDHEFSWSLVALIVPRDDKIGEISIYYHDQYGVDAFLS